MPTDLEFGLVCLALRRPQQAEDRAALRRSIAAGPDWRRIVEGARRHAVPSLLQAGLQACGSPDVPVEASAALRGLAVAATQRSLVQSRIVAEVAAGFAAAGVPLLALKGVVLSVQLFGDPARRRPRDIDLLIEPERLDSAASLLAAAGCRIAAEPRSRRQRDAHRRWIKDVGFVHIASGIPVELHHRLCDNPELLSGDFAELWREREEVAIAGVAVATLARRRLPLYLCAHGASHGWERLCWLVDFAAAVRIAGAETALAAARQAGLGAPMRHALLLAHRRLGLPLAGPLLAEAAADRRTARLDRIFARFEATAPWHCTPVRGSLASLRRYSLWQRLYRLALKPDWRYRRRQAAREYVSPADWDTVRLPERLFWLYPLARPVGWLLRRRRRRGAAAGRLDAAAAGRQDRGVPLRPTPRKP